MKFGMKAKMILVVFFCLLGIILHLPPVMTWTSLHFGEAVSNSSGIVVFALGWGILGAQLAFSAGFSYGYSRMLGKESSDN